MADVTSGSFSLWHYLVWQAPTNNPADWQAWLTKVGNSGWVLTDTIVMGQGDKQAVTFVLIRETPFTTSENYT